MKKPNFFILGAPKCGTTSLAKWLSEHKNVFLSPIKEPHYFNTDDSYIFRKSQAEYESLFKAANDCHIAIGEASVWYLYSQNAVKNIESYTNNAKYIVCLRNPIEMAQSLHQQLIFSGNEHVESFEAAWFLSSQRLAGQNVSWWCKNPRHLAYGESCKLGAQMKNLYTLVPRERVLPILLDDLQADVTSTYAKILEFLDVTYDGRTVFPLLNAAKERKSMVLRRTVRLLGIVKNALGMERSLGILTRIDQKNLTPKKRSPLPPHMIEILRDHFRQDVELLSSLIDRPLSHWIAEP